MTALTAEQLARLRQDIGDTNDPPAFEDEELQDIWTDEGEDWDKTILRAYERLLANAWKFTDYTQNESQEKKGQIFSHLERMVARLEKKVAEAAKAHNQIKIAGLKGIPPRRKDKP